MFEVLKQNKRLWDVFTRKEEYCLSVLDKHQRFPYRSSSYKNILEPEVSGFLVKNGFKYSWPNNKNFVICLTHDIDNIYPTLKYRSFTSLKYISKLQMKKGLDRFFKKENPYWNFKKIISMEKKYDGISSFYFMADGSTYDVGDLKDEFRFINESGCEIGLHGGYYSYNNITSILDEKQKLEASAERKIVGYRNHFLRFKIPDTWMLLSQAGLKYDTTLGYNETVGFRNGMCHPFKPFNLNTGVEIDILEIPLAIMDGTLHQHMRLNFNDSWQLCKKLIDTVESLNGVVTVIWHNHIFDDIYFKGLNLLYEKILDYSYNKNAWLTSGEKIYTWLMKKN